MPQVDRISKGGNNAQKRDGNDNDDKNDNDNDK